MSARTVLLSLLGLFGLLPTRLQAEVTASVPRGTPAAPLTQPANSVLPALDALLPDLQLRRDILQAVLESLPTLGLNTVDRPGTIAPGALPDKAAVIAISPATQERLPLQAFGRDVIYLTRSQIREQMLINFVRIDSLRLVDANRAEVRLFYPYRAMSGTVSLTLGPTGWQADTTGLSFHPPAAQLFFNQLFEGQECLDGSEYARWKNAYSGRRDGQCDTQGPAAGRKPAKATGGSND